MENQNEQINTTITEEVSMEERMEIMYLPKVISNSLNKNTDGLGEK
jgi:hypothetical protein